MENSRVCNLGREIVSYGEIARRKDDLVRRAIIVLRESAVFQFLSQEYQRKLALKFADAELGINHTELRKNRTKYPFY